MITILARNIWRFIVLVLLQVLIFNNIQLSGFINPYVYVIFIILLPFETPKWLLLVLGFLLGLSIDLFTNTPGFHAFATVLMAFVRPYILDFLSPRDNYEIGSFPRIYYYGFLWFLRYSAILIVIHHLSLFLIESFRFSYLYLTLYRSILSSMLTLVLIMVSQYVIYRK